MRLPAALLAAISLVSVIGFAQQNAPAQAAAPGYSLAGMVVQDSTNRPLARVLVTIGGTTGRRGGMEAMYLTSGNGGFAFSNLTAGKYRLNARKEGYSVQAYMDDDQFSTAIAVGPGIDSTHIVFPVKPPAALSGSVVDDRGDPVQRAQVYLLRKSVVGGRLRVRNFSQKQTDSSGGFTFDGLPQGAYLVAVAAQVWYARNFNDPYTNGKPSQDTAISPRDVAYPLTYYPGTSEPGGATPIEVRAGTQPKVQLTLHAVPAVHVNLNGGNETDIKPGRGVQAQLFALGPDGIQFPVNSMMAMYNGQASIGGVAPGRYLCNLMSFEMQAGQGRLQQHGSKVVDIRSNTTVDFGEQQKLSISGKLTLEGGQASGEPLTLSLVSEHGGGGAQTKVGADGAFQFETNFPLSAGLYTIQIANNSGLFVKSLTATGAKYADGELDIEGGNVQMAIVASAAAAKVDGIVLKNNQPFPSAMVLLLPQEAGSESHIRRDQSDSDGTFTVANVVPGKYVLVAIDDGHQLAFREPGVMKRYLARGQTVTVPVEGQLRVEVTARQR